MDGQQRMQLFNRRQLLLGSLGLAGVAAFRAPGNPARAQGGGEISVQFEARGGALETEVTTCITDVTAAMPGASITIDEPIVGDYVTKLVLDLSTGKGPDVFSLNSIAIAQLGAAGLVLPLNSYIDGWADWEQFVPQYKEYLAFDGQYFALPYSIDTHFLYYRTDLFEAAGLPVPWEPKTLNDLIQAAMALKATMPADGVPIPLYAGANASNSTAVRSFLPLLYANCGRLKNDEGKWIIDSPAIRATMQLYEDAYQTMQLVPQTVLSTPNVPNVMRRDFAMGKVGMLFDGCWVWDDWADVGMTANIGYTLFPNNCGDPFTVGGFGNAWFIKARTESPDLAWAFASCMLGAGPIARLNLDDPHVPPRVDAAADPGFADPFLQAMIGSLDHAVMAAPEPEFAELVEVIQNATGRVAAGEAKAGDVVEDYASELERVLGKENTVREI